MKYYCAIFEIRTGGRVFRMECVLTAKTLKSATTKAGKFVDSLYNSKTSGRSDISQFYGRILLSNVAKITEVSYDDYTVLKKYLRHG